MQALRRRIPFSFADDTNDDENRVLDEQGSIPLLDNFKSADGLCEEQDELITRLKTRAHATNFQYILAARLLLSLSIILWLYLPLSFSAL